MTEGIQMGETLTILQGINACTPCIPGKTWVYWNLNRWPTGSKLAPLANLPTHRRQCSLNINSLDLRQRSGKLPKNVSFGSDWNQNPPWCVYILKSQSRIDLYEATWKHMMFEERIVRAANKRTTRRNKVTYRKQRSMRRNWGLAHKHTERRNTGWGEYQFLIVTMLSESLSQNIKERSMCHVFIV